MASITSAGIGDILADSLTVKKAAAEKKPGLSFSETLSATQTAADKFMAYQNMTPAEKFRASYLAEKGLTEEDLAAMTPEDRMKIEAEIAQRIKEKLSQDIARRSA